MYVNPALVPRKLDARFCSFGNDGGENAIGESKYYFDRYLRKRGDANIANLSDLINKSHYYKDVFMDTRSRDKKVILENANKALTLDVRYRNANRLAIQQTVMQCVEPVASEAATQ